MPAAALGHAILPPRQYGCAASLVGLAIGEVAILTVPVTWFAPRGSVGAMQFEDLLYRYFGSRSLDEFDERQRVAGIERMQVDFGLSRDRGERFALWSVLYLLGAAPDLDIAFKDTSDRDAARNFMDLMARAGEEPEA